MKKGEELSSVSGGEVDIFRDTPVRYLGYSNEVGESFRAVIDKKWVLMSYALASGYVLADTASKSLEAWRHSSKVSDSKAERASRTAAQGLDVLVWQATASVAVPGLVINRICAATRYCMKRTSLAHRAKWISVGVGLSAIPFIIHPIDRATDYVMDHTLRPLLGTG